MGAKEEALTRFRETLQTTGHFTSEEIEEYIGYEFVDGPGTVYKQIRRYYLLLTSRGRRKQADEMLAETASFLDRRVEKEQDVHDLSVILARYISGFHVHPDLPQEVLDEKAQEFSLPLKTVTVRADQPYRVWHHEESQWAQWKAWRQGRPTVLGYGPTETAAIEDLRYVVQPDHDGTLDGLGAPTGPIIGGNSFSPEERIAHNKKRLEK